MCDPLSLSFHLIGTINRGVTNAFSLCIAEQNKLLSDHIEQMAAE